MMDTDTEHQLEAESPGPAGPGKGTVHFTPWSRSNHRCTWNMALVRGGAASRGKEWYIVAALAANGLSVSGTFSGNSLYEARAFQ